MASLANVNMQNLINQIVSAFCGVFSCNFPGKRSVDIQALINLYLPQVSALVGQVSQLLQGVNLANLLQNLFTIEGRSNLQNLVAQVLSAFCGVFSCNFPGKRNAEELKFLTDLWNSAVNLLLSTAIQVIGMENLSFIGGLLG
jgi:hypothetical protein